MTLKRVHQDDWHHYLELVEGGILPKETDGIGLEDYYEYFQVAKLLAMAAGAKL